MKSMQRLKIQLTDHNIRFTPPEDIQIVLRIIRNLQSIAPFLEAPIILEEINNEVAKYCPDITIIEDSIE